MTDKQHKLAELKFKLRNARDSGRKVLIWKMSEEQREYVENLGYKVVPYLYEIQTRAISGISHNKLAIISKIHYAYTKGRRNLYKILSKSDIEILKRYGIPYRRFKDKIVL